MAKKAKTNSKAEEPKKPKLVNPRKQSLPGMEHRDIPELEDLASEYVDIRDARMKLNASESDLKKRLRAAMKRHNRTHYANDGIEIDLIPPAGEDDVKVRVRKAREVDAETADGDQAEA